VMVQQGGGGAATGRAWARAAVGGAALPIRAATNSGRECLMVRSRGRRSTICCYRETACVESGEGNGHGARLLEGKFWQHFVHSLRGRGLGRVLGSVGRVTGDRIGRPGPAGGRRATRRTCSGRGRCGRS